MTATALQLASLRVLLAEPEIPADAKRIRAAVAITVEVRDPTSAVRAPHDEDYDVKIIASTRRVARDGGIIPIDAWAKDLSRYLANPVVLFAHDYRSLPVATCVDLEVDPGRGLLIAYWRFLTGISEDPWDAFCNRLKQLYNVGGIRACSVGFIVREWREPTDQEKLEALQGGDREPYWVAARAELLEMSSVPVPADSGALVDRALADAEARQIDVAPIVERWNALKTGATTAPAPAAAAAAAAATPTIAAPAPSRDAGSGTATPVNTPARADATPAEARTPEAPRADPIDVDALRRLAPDPAAPAREATQPDVSAVSDDRLRAVVREELAAQLRNPSAPAATDLVGLTVLDDETVRRIAREEVDRFLARKFGFPARTCEGLRAPSTQRM